MTELVPTSPLTDIRSIIDMARGRAPAATSAELALICRRVGCCIRGDALRDSYAGYAEQALGIVV